MIRGKKTTLRAMEPTDVDWLFDVENDMSLWHCGNTTSPISHADLKALVAHSDLDLYQSRQMRLMIDAEGETVGAIDVFEFDPFHLHASVGIVIIEKHREKGYAADALTTFGQYLTDTFGIVALSATIEADNTASRRLFESCGYELVGRKKQWLRRGKEWVDEVEYEKIHI